METEDGDDSVLATRGELGAMAGGLNARLDEVAAGLNARLDEMATKNELSALTTRIENLEAKWDATAAEIKEMRLEMKSNRTGVEQSGHIIPAADTVVAEETRFSLFSRAVLRHKGRRLRVVLVLKHSKKRV
jgi:outer membrane murein-binding lipoprotein Lpp